MPIYIPLTLDDLGEIDWDGKEFTILCRDGFASEINVGNMQVDQGSGAGQVINDAVYERNLLFYLQRKNLHKPRCSTYAGNGDPSGKSKFRASAESIRTEKNSGHYLLAD